MKKIIFAFTVGLMMASCAGKPAQTTETAPAPAVEEVVVEEAPVADSLSAPAATEVPAATETPVAQ